MSTQTYRRGFRGVKKRRKQRNHRSSSREAGKTRKSKVKTCRRREHAAAREQELNFLKEGREMTVFFVPVGKIAHNDGLE